MPKKEIDHLFKSIDLRLVQQNQYPPTTNMHIGLQNTIHLPHTETKVLKVTMINLWLNKDEIHTPRMHS
jgi:uncharacterized protein YbaP (TraB family)